MAYFYYPQQIGIFQECPLIEVIQALSRLFEQNIVQNCYIYPSPATGPGDGNGINGPNWCSTANQCGVGEGDCDRDADCLENLKCGQGSGYDNNCKTWIGFEYRNHDCCYDPKKRKYDVRFFFHKNGKCT